MILACITIRSLRLWLLPTCALASASLSIAQGTIAYHQSPNPASPVLSTDLDLDSDGQPDLHFYDASHFPANYWATDVSGIGPTRLLVIPNSGADGGSHLGALGPGSSIGGPLSSPLLWAAQNAPNSYGDALVLGSFDPEVVGGGLVPVGFIYDTTAFMGVHFQIDSEWHYGWVRIRGGRAGPSDDGQQFYLNPPAWIVDWAYETRPDTPILVQCNR